MNEVLLIGAGGLGCGAALALAAGGARRLVVIDDDVVDETNLHRQILHQEAAVGQPKAESLAASLRERFPELQVTPVVGRFDPGSALALLADCVVAVDGSDNLRTKFLANDAAVLAGKPLIHGAAVETWGQLLTVPAGGRPCYRCLFEELPAPEADAPSCAEAGVLGPVPGVIGALQATEALRILRGESPSLTGRLIRYDSRLMTMRAINFRRNRECGVCGDRPSITSLEINRSTQQECAS
jgi:molybdopterin/thiamine biosynthesis adenylyltransferase